MFDQRECQFICDYFHASANTIAAARVFFERHLFGLVFKDLDSCSDEHFLVSKVPLRC
ncbi:hypothetical protein KR49_03710 [Synechococcus sp. KORDI-49]|nr:hypothetical protein KR49_03710 [Synechococcus sp. KORDI-49]